MRVQVRAKAASETENLRLIESAKQAFAQANPGKQIGDVEDLLPYFPDNKMPVCPGGMEYENVLDLTQTTTSLANGMTSMEPPVEPLTSNGFNDIPDKGKIYLEAPVPATQNSHSFRKPFEESCSAREARSSRPHQVNRDFGARRMA